MINTIDTNIFIYSIYDKSSNKAILKFLGDEDRGPIPCYLHDELVNKITTLFWLLKSIVEKLNGGENTTNIPEIEELKEDFSNIYNFFFKSRFSNNIKKITDKKIDYINSLLSWLDEVKYYPNNEQEEKGILNKYKDKRNNLIKFEELHNADLKIVIIFYHYCSKKVMTRGRLVTEDKKLMKRKGEVEKEFDFVKLIRVEEYLKN